VTRPRPLPALDLVDDAAGSPPVEPTIEVSLELPPDLTGEAAAGEAEVAEIGDEDILEVGVDVEELAPEAEPAHEPELFTGGLAIDPAALPPFEPPEAEPFEAGPFQAGPFETTPPEPAPHAEQVVIEPTLELPPVEAPGAEFPPLDFAPPPPAPPAEPLFTAPPEPEPEPELPPAVAPPPAPEPTASDPATFVAGTHRVVIHTVDGQVKRGSLCDVALESGEVLFTAQPGGLESLAADRVKAIFFMLPPDAEPPAPTGKKVRVTFRDGRQVAGFSPDYDPDKVGFFMVPVDTRTHTARIWVYRTAVRQVSVS
jgi:hypothetical protein